MTHLPSQRRRKRTDQGPSPFAPNHLEDRMVYSSDGRLCYALLRFYELSPAGRVRSRNHFEAYDDLLPLGSRFAQVSSDFALRSPPPPTVLGGW